MLKVTYNNSYIKDGKDRFVDIVTGPAAEVEAFKKDRGDGQPAVLDEKGNPLYISGFAWGHGSVSLIKTRAGQYRPDNSAIRMAANLAAQHGGNFGQALANAAASQFMFGGAGSVTTSEQSVEESALDAKLDDLKKN